MTGDGRRRDRVVAVRAERERTLDRGDEVATDVTSAPAFSSMVVVPVLFGALAIPRELIVTLYGAEYGTAWLLSGGLAV